MKRLGIIGGLSPESTVSYYLHICRRASAEFGGSTSPEIVIYSVNLERFHRWRNEGRWDLVTDELVRACGYLHQCKVDLGLIATNTMHKVFEAVQSATAIPMLSILGVTADAVRAAGLTRIALLGTRFTMTDGFYENYLRDRGIHCVVPDGLDVEFVHRSIEEELTRGRLNSKTRHRYLSIIERLIGQGAQGVVLGCTEIPLLLQQEHVSIPVFDTAILHAEAAFKLLSRSTQSSQPGWQ